MRRNDTDGTPNRTNPGIVSLGGVVVVPFKPVCRRFRDVRFVIRTKGPNWHKCILGIIFVRSGNLSILARLTKYLGSSGKAWFEHPKFYVKGYIRRQSDGRGAASAAAPPGSQRPGQASVEPLNNSGQALFSLRVQAILLSSISDNSSPCGRPPLSFRARTTQPSHADEPRNAESLWGSECSWRGTYSQGSLKFVTQLKLPSWTMS
ncbi:hypothetical protein K438DRAFT_1758138 [Mycena galopus ATCC 62051]|nr:hypothetical protein K438DRAFT_1758138 [Mycena galopus ATCC 62051]